jgi:hypothetical protein
VSAIARSAAGSIIVQVATRWAAIDPLLPAPRVPSAGCAAELRPARAVALGICEHWAPESFDLSLRSGHLAKVPGADATNTVAVVAARQIPLPDWGIR